MLTEAHRGMFDGLIRGERVRVLENTSEDAGAGASRTAPRAAIGGATDGELRLLFLSNLFPEKGCFDLIDALDGARASGPAGSRCG